MKDIHQEYDSVNLEAKDLIPIYGFIRYCQRNKGNEELTSCTLREASLMIYSIGISFVGFLGTWAGLEKLLN